MRRVDPRRRPVPRRGPVAAVCRTCGEAAVAAGALLDAGFELRRIAIVANDYPTAGAAMGIEGWPSVAPAWVTVGCLNAIGSGLEGLGVKDGVLRLCRSALKSDAVVVLVKGTPADELRARRACRRR